MKRTIKNSKKKKEITPVEKIRGSVQSIQVLRRLYNTIRANIKPVGMYKAFECINEHVCADILCKRSYKITTLKLF